MSARLYLGLAFWRNSIRFWSYRRFFNLFLAACSAVNDNRDAINQEDVIRAYKTYFKLIKTDITKYKAKPDLIQQSGFGLIQKIQTRLSSLQ